MPPQNLHTAQKFIPFFTTLDNTILEPLLAPNLPPRHTTKLKTLMTEFPVSAKEYIESEGCNQVVVWASSVTEFREEAMDTDIGKEEWEFNGEYVFILTMDERGEKIVRCVEFLDSLATVRLLELVRRAKGNLERRANAEDDGVVEM
ncbi:hypothetical protein BDW74DRAFT_178055 [Aspergillus multicolor]|uniref:uncharacterized protein n=1 Tax=Aspergillus multicolor TaxID=41759 RepID=UPI003CCD6534